MSPMKSLQRVVVAVLLGVWCFPAVSSAEPLRAPTAEVASRPPVAPGPAQPSTAAEQAALAAREKQATDLQDFKGGGVSIYIGSGAAVVLLIILLIILL